MIKRLCILSSYYPSEKDPHYAFVGTLVEAFADMGIECFVISPCSWIEKKHKSKSRIEITKNGNKIKVYCPRFFVFPSRTVFGFKTYKLTSISENRAVWKEFKRRIGSVDAIYSHFISSGVSAALLSKRTGIPAFMACGESNIYASKLVYEMYKSTMTKYLNGIIAVSTPLKKQLREIGLANNNMPIEVIPNAIDPDEFQKKDKIKCRLEKGFNQSDFIVAFVGGYIIRKGFDKLQNVLLKHQEWKCIFIGSGDIQVNLPKEQVLFSGKVSHSSIPDYLNCSDVFVLPTLEEGCCNAIIEAMGCGLPIISSNRDFNKDILHEDNSILIDPENLREIEAAINDVYRNKELREKLAKQSELHSRNYSIDRRARRILSFIEDNSRRN